MTVCVTTTQVNKTQVDTAIMASIVTVCVLLSLSLFCCGNEKLPQCASQQSTIQCEAGKQLQIQYVYYTTADCYTDQTCLKKPSHVNDSFICEDERPHTCYQKLQQSVVDDIYNKCGDNQCNLWQVVRSGGSSPRQFCVVYICTDVSEAINPCQELPCRRVKHPVYLMPSRDDTTCHNLCSIRQVGKKQGRKRSVTMEWNFVDKSDGNQVEFRVINDNRNHSKSWTEIKKYYHQYTSFELTNRRVEINFNVSNVTSINRLWISFEYEGDILMHCSAMTRDTSVPDVTLTTIINTTPTVFTGGDMRMHRNATTRNTSVPDVTLTTTFNKNEGTSLVVTSAVGAVVAVVAIALLSLLIILLYKRHRRLRAMPKTNSSDGPEDLSTVCTDAPSQPAVPRIQTNQNHYAQVGGEQTREIHNKQMEHEQAERTYCKQVEHEQARPGHYEQVDPKQTRQSHYEQVEPEQARKSHYEQVEPEQARKSHYEQVEPEQARQSHYEQVEPEQARQSHYEQVEPEQARQSHYEQVEPEQARQSHCEQSRKGHFTCVESPSSFYGHLARNQAMVRDGENVYNHPMDQVTGPSVHNNGQASVAQGADDVYDELHRERRMVVIGNIYGTAGLKQELGAISD